jgi:hypothetical protein
LAARGAAAPTPQTAGVGAEEAVGKEA